MHRTDKYDTDTANRVRENLTAVIPNVWVAEPQSRKLAVMHLSKLSSEWRELEIRFLPSVRTPVVLRQLISKTRFQRKNFQIRLSAKVILVEYKAALTVWVPWENVKKHDTQNLMQSKVTWFIACVFIIRTQINQSFWTDFCPGVLLASNPKIPEGVLDLKSQFWAGTCNPFLHRENSELLYRIEHK